MVRVAPDGEFTDNAEELRQFLVSVLYTDAQQSVLERTQPTTVRVQN